MRKMTEAQFDKEYEMVVTEDGESTAWQSVEDIQQAFKGIEANRIWTYVDGENDTTYLISGIHHVNAFAFAVTEEPHDFLVEVKLDSA